MSKKSSKKSVAPKASAPAKKVTARKATKKTVAKKASTPAKKVATKKVVAKKVAKTAKKVAVKKTTSKKSATRVVAKVDLGWGNSLYIRGEGAGLSWDKGVAMSNATNDEWTLDLSGSAQFKLVRNDCDWSQGDNFVAKAGKSVVVTPIF